MDANKRPLMRLSRRRFLGGAATLVAWSQLPRLAYASTPDPRLVAVILRGALDGLAAVPPIGDPDYLGIRGDLAIGARGHETALPLDGFFALNDSMPRLHARYHAGEALIVHASATPYRARSHFDGQDVLENGMPGPRAAASGWLNRAVAALPTAGSIRPVGSLAISPTIPLILRGEAPVLTWTPPVFQPAGSDTAARLLDLYTHTDPELAAVLAAGQGLDMLLMSGGGMGMSATTQGGGNGAAALSAAFSEVTAGAATLLADADGPRIAALSFNGWDTHAAEGADTGRLSDLLVALDDALETLAAGLGPAWAETAVVVVTEFGRTVAENGTDGTDHGTGTTAFLLGGAVNGGRVVADWPGLSAAALFENRDLAPTTDLRAVLKGVLRDHLGLSEQVLGMDVFPESLGVRPMDGLIA